MLVNERRSDENNAARRLVGWFLEDFKQVLLVDNHAPLGYHVHDNLEDPKERKKIDVNDPYEALEFFVQRAKEISDET